MSQSLKDKLIYTPKEIKYFERVWKYCQSQSTFPDDNIVQSTIAAQIMSKSNLPREVLQKIWQYSSQHSDRITKKDFFFALKIISIKQNNLPINEQNILSTNFVPKLDIQIQQQRTLSHSESLGSRQSLDQDIYSLNQKTLMRIENYIDNRCKTAQKGILTRNESNDLFQSAAGLNMQDQQHLWNICDIEQKGFLTRGQFILALFFISQHKKSIQIPKILPPNLKEFLRNYQKKDKGSKKNLSRSKEKKIYQQKFESSMNLLLKKILDQENIVQEQITKQETFILNEEKEIENLQKCLNESIQLNRQIEEQNQILKNLMEFIQIQMFDKQKEVENVLDSQFIILEQFYMICQKVLQKKKDFRKFRSKLLDYLEKNIKDVQRQNSIEDTMTKVLDKNIQTEKELMTQPSFEPNNENPFNDFFDPIQQEVAEEEIFKTQNQIKEKQQMDKQKNDQEDQQLQKEESDRLDACSHIAKKDYGVKKVSNTSEKPEQQNLKEASIQTLEDKESIKLKDEMIPEDFQEYDKDDTKRSVKSDDEFQIHKQDFQKKDDEFFINQEINNRSKNVLRKSKES